MESCNNPLFSPQVFPDSAEERLIFHLAKNARLREKQGSFAMASEEEEGRSQQLGVGGFKVPGFKLSNMKELLQ